jgi:hypothetical protein
MNLNTDGWLKLGIVLSRVRALNPKSKTNSKSKIPISQPNFLEI